MIGLSIFFLFFLFRVLFRRTWLAVAAVSMIAGAFGFTTPYGIAVSATAGVVTLLVVLSGIGILVRFGVLSMIVAVFVVNFMFAAPLTLNLSLWYASAMYFPIAIVLGLALWSFRITLSGRRLLKGDPFDI